MENVDMIAAFIRERRSKEQLFEEIYTELIKEISNEKTAEGYRQQLTEIKEKSADAYKKAKQLTGTAWPEFEKFVSDFEKAIIAAKHSK